MPQLALVAVGGNALTHAGQRGTIAEQRENAASTARYIVQLLQRDYFVVLTHGNGPQVGAQLLRSEICADQVAPEPLDVCVANTQGAIGYLLEQAMKEALDAAGLRMPVATLLTQVVVSQDDPAFSVPSKPVGPFYSAEEARRRQRELGWRMVEDRVHGYRRVVASPEPQEIIELEAIRCLLRFGYLVIAAGGGGIPVRYQEGRLVGVEAVIDKDYASAMLASLLHVDSFIILTGQDRVYLNYQTPEQQALDYLTASTAQRFYDQGHFPAGSMGPKIRAAIHFLQDGGRHAIITAPDQLLLAVQEQAGTHLYPDTPADHPILR